MEVKSSLCRRVAGKMARALNGTASRTSLLFLLALFIGAIISARWIDVSTLSAKGAKELAARSKPSVYKSPQKPRPPLPERPLNCTPINTNCSSLPWPPFPSIQNLDPPTSTCPDYFRWIHEDLKPWKGTGITQEMVERARRTATFRLLVIDGKVYVERYAKAYQCRDDFTIWGMLQLFRRYSGRVPDLDLMFDCVDWPVVKRWDYRGRVVPPPLFRYCGDKDSLDIVFPDWSFWGWPEINIEPWEALLKDLDDGNKKIKWMNRDPTAYWKGNPYVADTRKDLLKCNVTETQDWNARVYVQDWIKESQQGYKESNLANQCTHRYKIYIEGSAWSVSEKYILACDSPTLLVTPHYYDFFTRALMPTHHYWPIKGDDKCRSIKYAVDWGNSHKQKAQAIGKTASSFILEDVKMAYVYDYMFHLLSEYSKLLRYKPKVPEKAVQYCSESMACPAKGNYEKFMKESFVKVPSDSEPCILPPPFEPPALQLLLRRKANAIKQVETWEQNSRKKTKL
ncbi:hypothetical protein AMTRI_Chr07g27780 [Amborella trichopoda]